MVDSSSIRFGGSIFPKKKHNKNTSDIFPRRLDQVSSWSNHQLPGDFCFGSPTYWQQPCRWHSALSAQQTWPEIWCPDPSNFRAMGCHWASAEIQWSPVTYGGKPSKKPWWNSEFLEKKTKTWNFALEKYDRPNGGFFFSHRQNSSRI